MSGTLPSADCLPVPEAGRTDLVLPVMTRYQGLAAGATVSRFFVIREDEIFPRPPYYPFLISVLVWV